MLFAARKSYAGASVTFMLASFFRSNGFILSGFIVWDMMVGPLLFAQAKFSPRRIFINLLNCSFFFAPPFLPYFYHEYDAYRSFCSQSTHGASIDCRQFIHTCSPRTGTSVSSAIGLCSNCQTSCLLCLSCFCFLMLPLRISGIFSWSGSCQNRHQG